MKKRLLAGLLALCLAVCTFPLEAAAEEARSYQDSRVPTYVCRDPQWEKLRFEWEDESASFWIEFSVDAKMYTHYRDLDRYYGVENFHKYINDEQNHALVEMLVDCFRQATEGMNYTDDALARAAVCFVQDTIEYQYDTDSSGAEEYPRYPVETLWERRGDCEDTSILLAAILRELGYGVGFLKLPDHVAVALKASDDYQGSHYLIDGVKYLYIETTGSNWSIGDIPEELQDIPAEFYQIP